MRKVTFLAVQALIHRRNFSSGNTTVAVDPKTGDATLTLHGNPIAHLTSNGDLTISACGWRTPTTKDRLNGLPGVSIVQKDWDWHLNGTEWDGGLYTFEAWGKYTFGANNNGQ